ncbi:RNA methyltransferase tRNA(m5U54)methyltransferase [Exophiala xenobiotica]|uniref:tRNA (guanine(26)-N(2))-dimethyltransferase n=1 Tax=Vermiconidia calcicola TaxID=1690605 RepID=A0AAV9QKM8_9PEZI|nr:RNA methyltransferase tRNA(m5U54)methyltransferase [Exophiala xenobiotica]KAK5307368.1 RNA methyltransferase tRNA(m5U54)methyltransferase [Exophiala xenobiotica]KAK5439372.1 RNA methyltransferase tRNA(m5U54)methyltransferase [Exophiala xenobiotica]KAK5543832.1 RNA methyltransferase tRNA(m5U54)methyltransferase [Vermiconidia calcicola]KAK5548510.1 RNA methyltransferase tRNA(m5U54)methyltransferase [Chaetothyriales sp. CCFEE 6169]
MAPSSPVEATVIDGKKYRNVREGLASVLAPYSQDSRQSGKQTRNNDEGDQAVFYNPIQQFNRDLSVLAITVYGEGAVVEKEARFGQKNQARKSAKERKKQKSKADSHDATAAEPSVANIDSGNQKAGAIADVDGSAVENGSNHNAETNDEPAGIATLDAAVEQANGRKRKADEITDPNTGPSTADPSKKAKTSDNAVEDEDDLLVEALSSEPLAEKGAERQESQNDATRQENKVQEAANSNASSSTQKRIPFTILDALSATGLRALRYAKEIPFATNVVANDLSPESVQAIELNIRHNDVKDKVHSNLGDARGFMYSKVGNEKQRQGDGYVYRFDVIDLDPYGTAAPFIDASLQALQDGGMLCVTCTDAGVFASTGYPEKTYALYGGMPIKGPHSHEGGLRLIINAVAISAARYGLAIEPMLSLYIDYYARTFIRVHRKPNEVKMLAGTTMTVYNCAHGCGAWTTQPLLRNQPQTSKSGETFYKFSFAQAPLTTPDCEHCGSKLHLCGPMWAGPLHNPHFVQRMLDKIPSLDKNIYGTTERLEGMLTLALEEDLSPPPSSAASLAVQNPTTADNKTIPRLPPNAIDSAPFFIIPNQVAKVIHCATPSENMMRGAILSTGYRVTRSHCKPGSIKTNAPWNVLWEIFREFMRTKAPIKEGAVKERTAGWNILSRLRGSERSFVSGLADVTKDQLKRCETKEDLKTVLHGMLGRLEKDEHASNAEDEEATTQTNNGLEEGEDQPHRSRSRSPSAVETSKLKIVFDEKLGREKPRAKLVRYQMNPRENWGPMSRAGRMG